MSKMMVYALKGAVGGNVEKVWGHEMQVMTVDTSDKGAVDAAKANGYSDSPNDVIEHIETKKLEAENKVMKGVLADSADKDRVNELEDQLTTALEEIAGFEQERAIYKETKEVTGDGVLSYDELTNEKMRAVLDHRKVKHVARDDKDDLLGKLKDSE